MFRHSVNEMSKGAERCVTTKDDRFETVVLSYNLPMLKLYSAHLQDPVIQRQKWPKAEAYFVRAQSTGYIFCIVHTQKWNKDFYFKILLRAENK